MTAVPTPAESTRDRSGPLAGVRVIELAGIGAAPFGAMVLADMGADVVRIDRPVPGDETAGTAPSDVDSITKGIMTRGRRSIVIDLKHPDGVAVALDLIAGSEAVIEGLRPGVMERLGLGPEPCLERNPALVYGRSTGWGQSGPNAMLAGHDLNYLALSGTLAPLGRRGEPPTPPLNLLADFGGGGMCLAFGVVCALIRARATGTGQVVDAAMVEGAGYLSTMTYELLGRGAWIEERESNPNDGGAPFYSAYETADGRYLAVAPMEGRFWKVLLSTIEVSEDDLPGAQWDRDSWPDVKNRLASIFLTRSQAEWCALLEGTDACVSPVLMMSEAPNHPHQQARDAFLEVDGVTVPAPAPRFSETPPAPPRGTCRPGADTDDLLSQLGLDGTRIRQLRDNGAVA